MIPVREAVVPAIPGTPEPGWAELCDTLRDLFEELRVDWGTEGNGAGAAIQLDRLKSRVYRVRVAAHGGHSFVLKRFDPWLARRNELVLRRWLPALGLAAHAPRLVTTAAERHGEWVWHVYEDLGDRALSTEQPDAEHVGAVAGLIADLHVRATGHTLVPACRHFCGNLGAPFLVANLRDAIAALEALTPPRVDPSPEQGEVRGRLLARLYHLRDELPGRLRQLETFGGPDTLLHGDLWTTNTLVSVADGGSSGRGGGGGTVARLIDWDHAAVGPVSYDLSTFLYRFPRSERRWILELYREAVARAGRPRLPRAADLNQLFETAELSRYANRVIWPALAILEEHASWGFDQLAEVDRWFEELEPALPV